MQYTIHKFQPVLKTKHHHHNNNSSGGGSKQAVMQ
jgi:hypothetical protein